MAGATRFSARDRAILAAVADTFVAGDGERRGDLAADALELVADPAQLRELRLGLRLMDTAVGNLVLAGRPAGIRSMSPADRERCLAGWGASRLARRRSAFAALRKLMTFLAYADPTADPGSGPGARLLGIDYRPDAPAVTTEPTPIRPLAPPLRSGTNGTRWTLEADAVVVGSGAGGGVVAAELTAAGRSVVVVEAGPFVDEHAMPRDELDAFDRLYLDHGLLTTWDGSITLLAGSAVGGGTLVNWMTSIPATLSVRSDWEREHGVDGVTGPAWDADVEAIVAALGIAPSTHIPPKDAAILRGARALGWDAAPTNRNAATCGDCGRCPFGCVRGTKRSGIRTHLAAAYAGGARLVADTRVTRVLIESGRAVGIEAESAVEDGTRTLVVRAQTVVLAAGALRSPAILQRSGVGHGEIGRNLRLHPVAGVVGRFSEAIEMWRGTMQAARSLEFVEPRSDRNGYVIESAPGHPGVLALALPWEGRDAHARLMADSRHLVPLIAITRDGGSGRTTLTRAGRVRIDYRLDATGVATMRHALVSMARLARAAGASDIVAVGTPPTWFRSNDAPAGADGGPFARFEEALRRVDFAPNRASVFSAHQMGSVRMGADPRAHPCDPWGRVRASRADDTVIRGLYVGDGSLFPTGIGVNPMLTIMAIARRVSRVIADET